MKSEPARLRGFSIAITGSGGSGAVTTGQILLEAAARAGYFGLMTRSAGPQIRGGESAAMVRFGPEPVECMDDRFDVLVALDWLNVNRFADEIPLDDTSAILYDPAIGPVPPFLAQQQARPLGLPLQEQVAAVNGGRLNMVALGALGAATGLPLSALHEGAERVLADKGSAVLDATRACVEAGYGLVEEPLAATPPEAENLPVRWNISGNEACGLGALRGGIRFVAAYPITPATEILEWMAKRLAQLGGSLLQAEDELASVNMIVGASFGGVPSLTATSGPGFSLMVEGLGLAVMSETPVVVVNVMRGGPSTGIPTKSEQSDLSAALHALHGDAPHLVLAPLTIADCAYTTQWAVQLAEHLQTVAVVLSDQALGQSRAVTAAPAEPDAELHRSLELAPERGYQRYALNGDGVSPMSLPGIPGGMYTADGLEHDERGTPSSSAAHHRDQLEKRWRKLALFDYGGDWAKIRGAGNIGILTWGSSAGAAFEAGSRLAAAGRPARVIALRLLAPLRVQALSQALKGVDQIWVVEQNHGGQLFRYLHGQRALPPGARSLAHAGPLPLRPGEIVEAILREEH